MTEKSQNSLSKNKFGESYLVTCLMGIVISSICILIIGRFSNQKVSSPSDNISNTNSADLSSHDKNLNKTSNSSIPKKISYLELFIRFSGLVVVFFILVCYLYLVQTQYDHAEEGSWNRTFYFGLTILGAGLTWDVSKHVATLPIENLGSFLCDLGKFFGWLIIYFSFGLLTIALITTLAHKLFIVIAFIAALSSALFCIFAGIRSIEHATTK
jgi:hypothetical protein